MCVGVDVWDDTNRMPTPPQWKVAFCDGEKNNSGNHDFTSDIPTFQEKVRTINPPLEEELVKQVYGSCGEARELFESDDARSAGIVFLDEGNHHFNLANGASLTVYANPYTPSPSDWGFTYSPQQEHEWKIDSEVDVVITHSPPMGILDYTDSKKRAGSPSLFAAVARARPKTRCFGHIHEGWGAKVVAWRSEVSENPSYFTDIDNENSVVVETLARMKSSEYDTPDVADEKKARWNEYVKRGCCTAGIPIQSGEQTLFVNASVEGAEEGQQQVPWIVDIDLGKE